MRFKSEASVLARLEGWLHLFKDNYPTPHGRNDPDNDIWFLMVDARECLQGLQRYAHSLEKSLAATSTDTTRRNVRDSGHD